VIRRYKRVAANGPKDLDVRRGPRSLLGFIAAEVLLAFTVVYLAIFSVTLFDAQMGQ
jgi:hypothetical protein